MKKLLALASVFLMLFCVSCSKDDDPTPPSPSQDKTYLQVLKQDISTILNKYPEYKKESQEDYPYGYLREAYYKLNGKVSDTPASELKAVSVQYGFDYTKLDEESQQVKQHILLATRDFSKGLDAEMTYQTDVALGYPVDLDIIENLDKIISLEHALKKVKESNVTLPPTNEVYLIKPAVPYAGADIVYLFNVIINNTVVYVDAQTGEVKTAEANK